MTAPHSDMLCGCMILLTVWVPKTPFVYGVRIHSSNVCDLLPIARSEMMAPTSLLNCHDSGCGAPHYADQEWVCHKHCLLGKKEVGLPPVLKYTMLEFSPNICRGRTIVPSRVSVSGRASKNVVSGSCQQGAKPVLSRGGVIYPGRPSLRGGPLVGSNQRSSP